MGVSNAVDPDRKACLDSGMIAYKAADLVWATRIKETAEALGLSARPTRSVETLRERLADSDVRALVVDLDAGDAVEFLAEGSAAIAEAGRRVRVVAFGPHVKKDLLQDARDAGAAEVMTNGAFASDLPEILIRLEGRG